jgi:putative endonuclease
MANIYNTTIYVGMTSDLPRRVMEHKKKLVKKGFTARYHLTKLVYYETGEDREGVLEREKQIKKYSREKKNRLITSMNPKWKDVSDQVL